MTAEKALAAEEIVVLTAVATGDLLAQGDSRGLPAPRRLISTLGLYAILGFVASFGGGPARIAAASGAVVMLATLVLGPGGKAITGLLTSAESFAQTPAGDKPTPAASSQAAKPSQSTQSKILGALKGIFDFISPIPLP